MTSTASDPRRLARDAPVARWLLDAAWSVAEAVAAWTRRATGHSAVEAFNREVFRYLAAAQTDAERRAREDWLVGRALPMLLAPFVGDEAFMIEERPTPSSRMDATAPRAARPDRGAVPAPLSVRDHERIAYNRQAHNAAAIGLQMPGRDGTVAAQE